MKPFFKIRRREMLLSFLALAQGNSFGDAMQHAFFPLVLLLFLPSMTKRKI
jgi:hypothetical protein